MGPRLRGDDKEQVLAKKNPAGMPAGFELTLVVLFYFTFPAPSAGDAGLAPRREFSRMFEPGVGSPAPVVARSPGRSFSVPRDGIPLVLPVSVAPGSVGAGVVGLTPGPD
jgi:hypothetical protein